MNPVTTLAQADKVSYTIVLWIPLAVSVVTVVFTTYINRQSNKESEHSKAIQDTLNEHSKALHVLALASEKLVGKVEPLQDQVTSNTTAIGLLRESVASLTATMEAMDKYQKEKNDYFEQRIVSGRKGDVL